jgi:hypothetical protein
VLDGVGFGVASPQNALDAPGTYEPRELRSLFPSCGSEGRWRPRVHDSGAVDPDPACKLGAFGDRVDEGFECALHLSIETPAASEVRNRYPKRSKGLDDLRHQNLDIFRSESIDALVEDVRDDWDVLLGRSREDLANPLDMLGITEPNIAVGEMGLEPPHAETIYAARQLLDRVVAFRIDASERISRAPAIAASSAVKSFSSCTRRCSSADPSGMPNGVVSAALM